MSALEPHKPNERLQLRRPKFNFRGLMSQIFPVVMILGGVLQLYVYAYLYHVVHYPVLGCISALLGTVLQIVGMIKLYQTARSGIRMRRRISVLIGFTLLWTWFFVYYGLQLVRNIFTV